jgi:hypothetical protein
MSSEGRRTRSPTSGSADGHVELFRLFTTFRYHAFITERVGGPVTFDADHRRHAVVELAIRNQQGGSGLNHCPSGDFNANGAWTVLASFAHHLVRWVVALGLEIRGHSSPTPFDASSSRHPVASRVVEVGDNSTYHDKGPGPRSGPTASSVSANYRPSQFSWRLFAARPTTSIANKLPTQTSPSLDTCARPSPCANTAKRRCNAHFRIRIDRPTLLHVDSNSTMRSLKVVVSVPQGATLHSSSTHDFQSCRNAVQSVRLIVPVRNVDEAAGRGSAIEDVR